MNKKCAERVRSLFRSRNKQFVFNETEKAFKVLVKKSVKNNPILTLVLFFIVWKRTLDVKSVIEQKYINLN